MLCCFRPFAVALAAIVAVGLLGLQNGCDSFGEEGDDIWEGSQNSKPIASFTVVPISGTVETVFTFDAAGSRDAETVAEALRVRWDWDSDGTYETAYANNRTATHQFATPGTHTVTLEVLDAYNATATTTRTVAVAAP